MSDVLGDLIARYGYALVAVFLFVEAVCVPIPGETALVTAAAIAGRGTMSIVGVMIAAFVGTVSGSSVGYWLGLHRGTAFVARHGRWLRITEGRLEGTRLFFDRHGAKTVVFGRFVAFLRSFIGLFAGISRMPARRFAVYNTMGGAVWVVTFSAIGYLFGRNLPRLVHDIGRVGLLVAVLVALIAGVVFLWRWYLANRATLFASVDHWWDRVPLPRRFAQTEYLGLHLAIGFVISLAAIFMFGSITEDIVEGSPLTRFDVTVATRLHESASPAVLRLMSIISGAGSPTVMTLLFVAGATIFAVRGRGLTLADWCAAFIGGSFLDAALRFVVRRSQLPFAEKVVQDWATGLVSGHALGAVIGYGMLAYFLAVRVRGRLARLFIVIAATGLVVAIAISRLYLGVHYVSDETAGIAAGFLWVTACISGLEIARQRPSSARGTR